MGYYLFKCYRGKYFDAGRHFSISKCFENTSPKYPTFRGLLGKGGGLFSGGDAVFTLKITTI